MSKIESIDAASSAPIRSPQQLNFALEELPQLPLGQRILMVDPGYFDVESTGNPHMRGNIGRIDRFTARQQWLALRACYEGLGLGVDVLESVPLLPDLVFSANQVLPVPPGLLAEGPAVVPSIMRSARRQAEVPHVAGFFANKGLHIEPLNPNLVPRFEGSGDALWVPGRAALLGAVGPRSARQAYEFLHAWTGVTLVQLKLVDIRFYHLDTCLSVLDERTAVYFPDAFDAAGNALLEALFPTLVAVHEEEAMAMVCNGHCPDGKHYLVQRGCARVAHLLAAAGFEVIELDTSEFLLSGGSVFCMKQQYWA